MQTSLPCAAEVVGLVVGELVVVGVVIVVGVVVCVVVVGLLVAVVVMVVVLVGEVVAVVLVVGDVVTVEEAVEVTDVVGVVRSHASKPPAPNASAASFSTAAVARHEASVLPSSKYPPNVHSMPDSVAPPDHSVTNTANVAAAVPLSHPAASISRSCPLYSVHANVPASSLQRDSTSFTNAACLVHSVMSGTER
jgi:hypothetical protein